MTERLSLGEYLVIASEVTGIPVEVLAKMKRVIALADSALAAPLAGWGGELAYPDLTMRGGGPR